MRFVPLLALAVLATCGHSGTLTPGGGGDCTGSATSSLPGVSIVFPKQTCTFTLAQAKAGITLRYTVQVAQDGTTRPTPQDGGHCERPGKSGLVVHETLGDATHQYCLCDTGLCASSNAPVPLVAGSYAHTFLWDGKSWGGPSDTGLPKGPAFPPGTYTLRVDAKGTVDVGDGGTQAYEVVGSLPITLTK